MPFDAERVGQLRTMLREARKRKLYAGLKARRAAMTALTLRRMKNDFIVSGPDIEPAKFKSRREWCMTHYPGSPIKEIGANATEPRSRAMPRRGPQRRPTTQR
jgi:hypothetical protein